MTWPTHGDFVRPTHSGNVHIATEGIGRGGVWRMACGKAWSVYVLLPATAEDDRQCSRCWESM